MISYRKILVIDSRKTSLRSIGLGSYCTFGFAQSPENSDRDRDRDIYMYRSTFGAGPQSLQARQVLSPVVQRLVLFPFGPNLL